MNNLLSHNIALYSNILTNNEFKLFRADEVIQYIARWPLRFPIRE